MTTGVTCAVFVDGVRAADGCMGDSDDAPAILEGLNVTWGRSDTMSQPAPDACSFSVLDPVGGDAFTGIFRTGRRVDVVATGDTWAEPSLPTFINPGFETTAVTWAVSGGTAQRVTTRPHTGAYALQVMPTVPGQLVSTWLAPGAFQPAGTNPDAWDLIPTTQQGQTWAASVSVWLPIGARVSIYGALFSGPYATAGQVVGEPQVITGAGAWVTVTAERNVQSDNHWVGFRLDLLPTGAAWDQMPPALTWNGVDASLTWDQMGALLIDDVQVTAPEDATGTGVLVFSGRITDLSAQWDEGMASPVVDVTAMGFTADLDNRLVGDTPWAVETVSARAQRILTLAALPITIDIDDTVAATLISWRDVDKQGATGLLQSLAVSVDGVLWPAVHLALGAYLKLEDVALRASLLKLELSGGLIVVVHSNPEAGWDITACVILQDPVTWIQDVSDVVTRVTVGWKVQGLNDEGNPVTSDSSVELVNPALETQYGTRGASVSTELQAAADASAVAQRVLSRATPSGWRASGLAIDDNDLTGESTDVALMMGLLDGTSRIGAPLVIGDLPNWSPAGSEVGAYLEGGTYSYVGGRWVLSLGISVATGIGQSAAWDELDPAWTWNQWDPGLTWNDLRGVTGPGEDAA